MDAADPASGQGPFPLPSKRRIEALVDGMFAIAMTPRVIDRRLPEPAHVLARAEARRPVAGTQA